MNSTNNLTIHTIVETSSWWRDSNFRVIRASSSTKKANSEFLLYLSEEEKIKQACIYLPSDLQEDKKGIELLFFISFFKNRMGNIMGKVTQNETELLDQKNRELSSEVVSLKSQLKECNAKLADLEDEMEQNASVLEKYRTENIDLQSELNESKERIQNLLTEIATIENKINSLEQLVNEGIEESKDLVEKHEVTKHFLGQRNEILQEEVDRNGRLLDAQNQRVKELESALQERKSRSQIMCKKWWHF